MSGSCHKTSCSGSLKRKVDAEGPYLQCNKCGEEFDFPKVNVNREALTEATSPKSWS